MHWLFFGKYLIIKITVFITKCVLRRKLPKLRRQISVEEREEYGFPANAIELAFKRDSRFFENVEAIKIDSTKNISEVTQE
uniref:Uncharacterized protein n=1 Tax=Panagrolaimus davidi TaxID=227884 RepID=A0A914QKK7_9BILA